MNMYLYGYGPEGTERFILVDMGVTLSDDGIDARGRSDHGRSRLDPGAGRPARGDLHHPRPRGPCRRSRPALAPAAGRPSMPAASPPRSPRSKMERAGQPTDAVRQVDAWPHVVHAGPFTVGFMPIAHSIPESSALVIDTPAGRIFHSADFKTDPTPLVGEPFDARGAARDRRRGREGPRLRFDERLQPPIPGARRRR